MNLTQESVDAAGARQTAYTLRDGDLRVTIHPDGRKVYSVVVTSRGRKASIELGPHRALARNLDEIHRMERAGVDLNRNHTLDAARRLAELCKLLYWPAVDLYAEHHGDGRAEAFAQEVIERATAYDAVRAWEKYRASEAQRRQRRKDLDATAATARKLGALLTRTDIRCHFDMADGQRIGYADILAFLQSQVEAERAALTASSNRGRPRHDIDALAVELANAANLYRVPREAMLPLVHLVADDASDKTVTKRRK